MNLLKTTISTALLALATSTSFAVMAKSASQPAGSQGNDAALVAPPGATATTEGEIRKVDKETKKLTIKHGAITNLDMPAMTMLFQVKDPALLDKVKAGDKVKFRAEMIGGRVVVTDIQMAP